MKCNFFNKIYSCMASVHCKNEMSLVFVTNEILLCKLCSNGICKENENVLPEYFLYGFSVIITIVLFTAKEMK